MAVRILGDITREKVRILQDADDIFIQGLRDWKVKDENGNETSLYHQVWQAGVILLPVQSVGVMGDERTYERAVALRAVTSTDAMTADWAHLLRIHGQGFERHYQQSKRREPRLL